MARHETVKLPEWVNADRIVDISDIWVEQCDPENECGYGVDAYLHDEDGDLVLRGISIEDTDVTLYHDVAWCRIVLTPDVVWRIEAAEMETA